MRRPALPGVKLDMTPMIDIVFQLLIFFVLTFRIVEEEGQFDLSLPKRGITAAVAPAALPLNVRLVADPAGELAAVYLADRRLSGLAELHREVERLLSDPDVAAASEANLSCDPNLAYEHCIAAVTAVSGSVGPGGEIVHLIERIRFAPPVADQ